MNKYQRDIEIKEDSSESNGSSIKIKTFRVVGDQLVSTIVGPTPPQEYVSESEKLEQISKQLTLSQK